MHTDAYDVSLYNSNEGKRQQWERGSLSKALKIHRRAFVDLQIHLELLNDSTLLRHCLEKTDKHRHIGLAIQ